MSSETRGEYELVFFKKLDNEFNKIKKIPPKNEKKKIFEGERERERNNLVCVCVCENYVGLCGT